jgi:hypothetical protein
MWDMYNEGDEEIRVTGLQPDKGAFPSRRAALASFIKADEGWRRHEDGFIVFHTEDCSFGSHVENLCDCMPLLIAPMAGDNH